MSLTDGLELEGDVGLKLAFHIGRLADEMELARKKAEREAQRKQRLMPIDAPIVASGVYPSSGNMGLVLGGPELGFFWEVRSLVIGGTNFTTAPAGTGYFAVTGLAVGQPGTSFTTVSMLDLSLMNLRDIANAAAAGGGNSAPFPTTAFYGTRQFAVQPQETLVCIITGGTNGTQYVVAGKALQYPVEAYDDVIEI